MRRKVCVVTGSRAEFGLLRWVIEAIRAEESLALQLIATGAHLSPEFGLTFKTIEELGFQIDRKVEMLVSSDTGVGVAKSLGLALIGFGDALQDLQPDLLLLLGDRYETFAAAAAALAARVPVAHVHGGELTRGAIDDAMRHAITKMSHLHFVAAEAYRRRVIQLGEQPERVFRVGALGIESIARLPLLGRAELEAELGFELGPCSLLITFHPATLEEVDPRAQMAELLAALETMSDVRLIFTMPNADPGGLAIANMITHFVATHANARAYHSLGQTLYLSCARHVDAVVGNSSSGLIEVPTLGKPTVNIGNRQQGRLKASSVIDCSPERHSIIEALRKIRTPAFQRSLRDVRNPYGSGTPSTKIVEVIRNASLQGIIRKSFYDIAGQPSGEGS